MGAQGWTASLDDAGYKTILKAQEDEQMEAYIRRIIKAHEARITDESRLKGRLVNLDYGSDEVWDCYGALLHELSQVGWLDGFNIAKGSNAKLDDVGYRDVASLKSNVEM